jgi:hypothetical protein
MHFVEGRLIPGPARLHRLQVHLVLLLIYLQSLQQGPQLARQLSALGVLASGKLVKFAVEATVLKVELSLGHVIN